jgi:Protein of unknown function (DUF1376)
MKWYPHDPSAALAGMIGLTVEERGAYYTLMDLQYARAPHGDVTDELVVKALAVRPQVWRRLKANLIAKGKVHETDGKLSANRVAVELKLAANRLDKSPQTGGKLGSLPGVSEVVSDTTSAKINELDGLRARATTTTTSILESSNGKGREIPEGRVVLPPVVNYRDPGNDYRSPPRTKSDNVLEPTHLVAAKRSTSEE